MLINYRGHIRETAIGLAWTLHNRSTVYDNVYDMLSFITLIWFSDYVRHLINLVQHTPIHFCELKFIIFDIWFMFLTNESEIWLMSLSLSLPTLYHFMNRSLLMITIIDILTFDINVFQN